MEYTAFLSSLVLGHENLRGRVHALGRGFGGVYVAEIDEPVVSLDPLAHADRLLELVRQTPIMFCILGAPQLGTSIEPARASFFELELFQACLIRRPVHVIQYEHFTPSAMLREVLSALRPTLRATEWSIVSDDTQALAAIRTVLEGRARETTNLSPARGFASLVTNCWKVRARTSELGAGLTPVRWLNGVFLPGAAPNEAAIRELVRSAGSAATHERRLGRLWMALRELMAAPYTDPCFEAFLPSWSTVLSQWWASASWYGLHSHAFFGPLAAGKTVEEINSLLRRRPHGRNDPAAAHPAIGLASAHYSLAKVLADRSGRRWHFREAARQIDLGLADYRQDQSTLLMMRGSLLLRMHHPWRACEVYETALRLRIDGDAGRHRLGEAVSELGFAYLMVGRLFKGRQMLEQGVQLLSDAPERGFLLRAQRKLAVAYTLTGRIQAASRLKSNIRREAARTTHFDQSRQA